LVKDNECRQG